MKVNERWIACLLVFVGALASYGVFKDYSYWADELFSVSASLESWQVLLDHWLLPDVHPPLYQLLLKSWILLFGDSEPATRSLSLVFALSTILFIVFYGTARRELKKYLVFAALMSSMPFFLFYAQETRPYALMMFLSTVLTVTWLDLDKSGSTASFVLFCAAALLLALTHYFGLILSGLLLLSVLAGNRFKPDRRSAVLIGVGLLCLAWPLYHLTAGDLLGKANGNFWIEVTGPLDTIANLASDFLPAAAFVEQKFKLTHGVLSASLLAFILSAVLLMKRRIGRMRVETEAVPSLDRRDMLALALLILVYLALVMAADAHSPFSTARNFIAVMPAVFLLIASAVEQLEPAIGGHYLASLLLWAYLASSLGTGMIIVRAKQAPREDYRGTAIALGLQEMKSAEGVFLIPCASFNDATRIRRIESYYLNRFYPDTHVDLAAVCTESPSLHGRQWDFLLVNHAERKEIDFVHRFFPDLPIVSGSSDRRLAERSFSVVNFDAERVAERGAKP